MRTYGPRFWSLVWWSLCLAWTRNKQRRWLFRQRIWAHLGQNLQTSGSANGADGPDMQWVRAVWLGSTLAARSLVRFPVLSEPLSRRLRWIFRVLGHTNGCAIVSAYLAWRWIEQRESPKQLLSPSQSAPS
jgi:hypothetical protein